MDSPKFTWIQTRDGSPTLWSNELGESFRSVKGAFTESWAAFVEPSLNYLKSKNLSDSPSLTVGEFGLGPGTNWLIWSLARDIQHMPQAAYFVIESHPESFELGLLRWQTQAETLSTFFSDRGLKVTPAKIQELLSKIARPEIFDSLESARVSAKKADLWFHDPFGFDVNPDGYSPQTLSAIASLLHPHFFACSYACNKNFKLSIEAIEGAQTSIKSFKPYDLKRERLEFYR